MSALSWSTQEIEQRLAPGLAAIERGYGTEGVHTIVQALTQIRKTAGRQWAEVIKTIRATKAFEISQLCPFTNHSFRKPRGYPGDALLLDWIYRDFRVLPSPAPLTLQASLYRGTGQSTASMAVRWRRRHLADLIDESARACAAASRPRVLAVACGHLREADLSTALQRGLVERVVALDQDEESLKEVNHRYTAHGMPVETVCAPIRNIIAGRYPIGNFDLIYSAGLYDYLEERVAQKLTATLFAGLKPGGQLVVTNFLHDMPDVGWTEAMMDWFLIYRGMTEIDAFAAAIPAEEIASARTYMCPTRCIGYLSLRKAGG